jgi:hypothetical protein
MAGIISGCHNWGYLHLVVGKDAVKHLRMHITVLHKKERPILKDNRAEVEKSWSKMILVKLRANF